MAKKTASNSNKFVSAGVGAVVTFQSAIEEGFDNLVTKGEKARKDYRASIEKTRKEVRDDVTKRFNDVKNRVLNTVEKTSPINFNDVKARIESVTDAITERTSSVLNIPTSKDIDELHAKLDRVITKVAA